jgi:hypothetical protein
MVAMRPSEVLAVSVFDTLHEVCEFPDRLGTGPDLEFHIKVCVRDSPASPDIVNVASVVEVRTSQSEARHDRNLQQPGICLTLQDSARCNPDLVR